MVIFLSMVATILTTAYSVRLFIRAVLSTQKRDPITRFSEPVTMPILMLRFGALFRGAMILGASNPLALEPFNPFIKRIFTLFLFASTLLVCSTYGKGGTIIKRSLFHRLHRARRKMLFLRGVRTQKAMSCGIEARKIFCSSDQS